MKNLFVLILYCSLLTIINAKDFNIVTIEYPPYSYLENNKIVGINVDIAAEALKRIGYEAKVKFVPWQRALFFTKYGDAHGILSAAYKKSRAKYLNYPEQELFTEEWYCFKLKNTKITLNQDLSNLSKISIGVIRNYFYGGKIQMAINKKSFKKIIQMPNDKAILDHLFKKKYDMLIGNDTTIALLANELGYSYRIERVKITGSSENYLLSSEKTYLAFSKKATSKKLLKEFSNSIKQMREDGTIKNIINKYL